MGAGELKGWPVAVGMEAVALGIAVDVVVSLQLAFSNARQLSQTR